MTPARINSQSRIFIIVLALLLSVAACSPGKNGGKNSIKFSKIDDVIQVSVEVIEVTPEATADPEATPEATSEPDATPEATEEASDDMEVIIVIEGPVTAINNNIITVFDYDIQVEVNNPIWVGLEIGDLIRAEGITVIQGNVIIIVAVNIIIIEIPVIIWGPIGVPITNCRITPKGKVKCTKKGSHR